MCGGRSTVAQLVEERRSAAALLHELAVRPRAVADEQADVVVVGPPAQEIGAVVGSRLSVTNTSCPCCGRQLFEPSVPTRYRPDSTSTSARVTVAERGAASREGDSKGGRWELSSVVGAR